MKKNETKIFKPFVSNAPFLYLLKWFSDVFRGYRRDALGTNEVIKTIAIKRAHYAISHLFLVM